MLPPLLPKPIKKRTYPMQLPARGTDVPFVARLRVLGAARDDRVLRWCKHNAARKTTDAT
jgi:hypothetical protein